MAKLILYRETPDTPVHAYDITGDKDITLNIGDLHKTIRTLSGEHIINSLKQRAPVIESRILELPILAQTYANKFYGGDWPEFTKFLIYEIERLFILIANGDLKDTEGYFDGLLECFAELPVKYTIKIQRSALHRVKKISYCTGTFRVRRFEVIHHDGDQRDIYCPFRGRVMTTPTDITFTNIHAGKIKQRLHVAEKACRARYFTRTDAPNGKPSIVLTYTIYWEIGTIPKSKERKETRTVKVQLIDGKLCDGKRNPIPIANHDGAVVAYKEITS